MSKPKVKYAVLTNYWENVYLVEVRFTDLPMDKGYRQVEVLRCYAEICCSAEGPAVKVGDFLVIKRDALLGTLQSARQKYNQELKAIQSKLPPYLKAAIQDLARVETRVKSLEHMLAQKPLTSKNL